MRFYKYIPIEIYSIFLPSLLILCALFYEYINSIESLDFSNLYRSMSVLFVVGAQQINLIFVFLWIFVAIYIVSRYKDVGSNTNIFSGVRSLAVINVLMGIISAILGVCIMYLFALASEDKVFYFTLTIDNLERNIFGGLPGEYLVNMFSGSSTELFIINSYIGLSIMTIISVIVFAFSSKKIFRKIIVAFFLAFVVAIPFYIKFQVVSPDATYISRIIKINDYNLNISQSEKFSSSIKYFQSQFISKDNKYFATSSIPSLHVAWGLIITLGVISLRKKLLSLIFLVWLFFMTIGTFYTFQHYALDSIAGLIFGFVIYYLAGLLIKLEKKYYIGIDYYTVCDLLIEMRGRVWRKTVYLFNYLF